MLDINTKNGVQTLTLNRPEAMNALSADLMSVLKDALDKAADNPDAKVIVIKGAGRGFCAGHDLKQLTEERKAADKGAQYFADLFAQCSELMQTVVMLPKPVIAQVHGIATAAGAQLTASCDLAVAADTARFATPGVNIGLFCSTPMVAVSRNISNKHAMEMLLTGNLLSATEAERMGLINRVVPEADLETATTALAEQIATKSPLTLKIGKEAFYRQREMNLADAYAYTAEVMTQNMLIHDAEEGIGAFIEKRAPVWRGE